MPKEEQPNYGIDEMAVQAFESIGFKHPFPKELVDTYKKFKMCRDKLTPGRLSAEGYAACVVIANMTTSKGEDPGKKSGKESTNGG